MAYHKFEIHLYFLKIRRYAKQAIEVRDQMEREEPMKEAEKQLPKKQEE